MSNTFSPIDECPFDEPARYTPDNDYDAWAERVWAEIGDHDAYGPFAGRDDEHGPF
jgi:hypothetical protein